MNRALALFKALVDGQTHLTAGILHDRVTKNEEVLFNRIDPGPLARVYDEEHNRGYAEPEFCGKYIDTAMTLWRSSGREKYLANAKKIVDSIIANQRNDGYLGTYRRGGEFVAFGIWNAQFTIRGLVSYYQATGDREALACACRGADFIVSKFTSCSGADLLTSGNQNIQHSCLLPDMVWLYEATGNPTYLNFCQYIVDRWESSERLRLVSQAADCLALGCTKAAEMLICYQGLVAFYQATGEPTHLAAAEAYWASVHSTQIGPSGNGSVKEYWHTQPRDLLLKYDEHPNENCVAVCWMKLSAMLLQCTGDARYADAFEQSLYNHLLGSQAADGSDFSYYQALEGAKIHATNPRQYSCCRYRGMNMLAQLSRYVFLEAVDGPVVNLYASSETTVSVQGTNVKLTQNTQYPREGRVAITVHPSTESRFSLHLRKPKHCTGFDVFVDGNQVKDFTEHLGYTKVERVWANHSQTVEIRMDLRSRGQRETVSDRDCLAIFRGPLLLALDSHEQANIDACAIRDENRLSRLAVVGGDDLHHMIQCTVPGEVNASDAPINLIDYATAGSRDTTQDRFRVWIPTEMDRAAVAAESVT